MRLAGKTFELSILLQKDLALNQTIAMVTYVWVCPVPQTTHLSAIVLAFGEPPHAAPKIMAYKEEVTLLMHEALDRLLNDQGCSFQPFQRARLRSVLQVFQFLSSRSPQISIDRSGDG